MYSRARTFLNGALNRMPVVEICLVFAGFLLFFGFIIARKTGMCILFYDCRSSLESTNTNWRVQLLVNKVQQLQRERPGYFWFAALSALLLFEFGDMQFMSTQSTQVMFQEYTLTPVSQASFYLALCNLLLLSTNLFKMLLHFLYPS